MGPVAALLAVAYVSHCTHHSPEVSRAQAGILRLVKCLCVCMRGRGRHTHYSRLIDREKQKLLNFCEKFKKKNKKLSAVQLKPTAWFLSLSLSFSVNLKFLFSSLFILERWLCSVYRTHSLGGLHYPRQTS